MSIRGYYTSQGKYNFTNINPKIKEILTNNKFHNFDFGKEWDKIIPHLDDFLTQYIKISVENLKKSSDFPLSNDFLTRNISPAQEFATGDSHASLLNDIENDIFEKHEKSIYFYKMNKKAKIPKCIWKSIEYYLYDSDIMKEEGEEGSEEGEEERCDRSMDHLESLTEIVMRECGYDFNYNEKFIGHWIPFGDCHNWNSNFSFYMANKLFPEENWIIITSDAHTSIITLDTHRMFDILLWGYGRLWKHLEEVDYSNEDMGVEDCLKMLLV